MHRTIVKQPEELYRVLAVGSPDELRMLLLQSVTCRHNLIGPLFGLANASRKVDCKLFYNNMLYFTDPDES